MRTLTFISLVVALLAPEAARADSTIVDSLASRGQLRVPVEQARLLDSELGQLFVVNVDGFGYANGPLALEPDFTPMVERLQVGGVIPHYGTSDYQKIRATNRELVGMTKLPLLVCCDIVRLRVRSERRQLAAAFGDGYVGGFVGKYRALADGEFRTLAKLNAFAFASVGMNVALGPTVDDSTGDASVQARARVVIGELRQFGLFAVAKHFPFLPTGANLHRSSPDTRVPLDVARRRFAAFRDLAAATPIMMTTHLYDSAVDSSIVTFSAPWISILRSDTGFSGLLMSDGLLMLRNYADKKAMGSVPAELRTLDPTSAWAVRAILVGHDFVIVEGSAARSLQTFTSVLRVACSGTALGNELAGRIQESYGRIRQFKIDNETALSRRVDVSDHVIGHVISIVPREGADLRSFRFNADSINALMPEVEQAAMEPTP